MYLRKPSLAQLRSNETLIPRLSTYASHLHLCLSITQAVHSLHPLVVQRNPFLPRMRLYSRVRLLRRAMRRDWSLANATNFALQPILSSRRGFANYARHNSTACGQQTLRFGRDRHGKGLGVGCSGRWNMLRFVHENPSCSHYCDLTARHILSFSLCNAVFGRSRIYLPRPIRSLLYCRLLSPRLPFIVTFRHRQHHLTNYHR